MKDYTDYYAASWSIFEKMPNKRKRTLTATAFLAPLLIMFLYFSWTTAHGQPFVNPWGLFITLGTVGLVYFLVYITLWDRIRQSLGNQLIAYSISQEGIRIDNKRTSYDNIDTKNTLSVLRSSEASDSLVLTIPKENGQLELPLPDQKTKADVIKSLTHYLNQ